MNVLIWHVHAAWLTAFFQGRHEYYVPVLPGRPADGRGRARTYDWPDNVHEILPLEARMTDFDLVVLQRPSELTDLVHEWTGRRPGVDLPAVYLEHNVPQGRIEEMRHPLAGRTDIPVVHVTDFNDLMWDCGAAPTRVIGHGVPDPGERYSGEIERCAVVINEAARRGRVCGADLLPGLNAAAGLDLFGIASEEFPFGAGDLPHDELLHELPRRRLYAHPYRWTSLGLALIEAMLLAMPVVALATTSAAVLPSDAAVVTADRHEFVRSAAELASDSERCKEMGSAARDYALKQFPLEPFLAAWDDLMLEVAGLSRKAVVA